MHARNKIEGPRAATPGPSQPIAPQEQKGSTMLEHHADDDQVPGRGTYPVDSATRTCCGGIGRHTPECPEAASGTDEHGRFAGDRIPLSPGTSACADGWQTDGHQCPFAWCTIRASHPDRDHWSEVVYVPASLRHGDPYHLSGDKDPLRVGVGAAYAPGEMPAVVLHLNGGQYDYDHDAFLRLDEAHSLRQELDKAIKNAAEALGHMFTAISSSRSPNLSEPGTLGRSAK